MKLQGLAARCAGLVGRIMTMGITRHTGGVMLRASGAALGLWLAAQATGLVGDALVTSRSPDIQADQATQPTVPDRTTTSSIVASSSQWTSISRPLAVFNLSSPETEALGLAYTARRHTSGEREDSLSYGQFAGATSHLHLTLGRNRSEAEPNTAFLIETIRFAARSGLSAQKITTPSMVMTKFGMVETADGVLGAADHQRNCLVYRFMDAGNPVRLSGWLCGAQARPADRQQLSCLIDRLHLNGSGEDKEMRATFTAAELRRDPRCNPPRLAATGRKTSWLDADGKAPALRGGGNAGNSVR